MTKDTNTDSDKDTIKQHETTILALGCMIQGTATNCWTKEPSP